MAGGSGKRMRHHLPKQLLTVGHAPMLVHLFDLADRILTDIVLVLSESNRDTILNYLIGSSDLKESEKTNLYTYRRIQIRIAIQEIADGTGGAVRTARDKVFFADDYDLDMSVRHNILVLSADVPLISSHTAITILNTLEVNPDLKCVIYGQERDDPYGYGRILLTPQGEISIVEQKDIESEEVNNVSLINTGIYAFEGMSLFDGLFEIDCENAQGEYYLTDVPSIIQKKHGVGTIQIYKKPEFINWDETLGANTPEQLEAIREEYQKKFQLLRLEPDMSNETLRELCECLSELTTVGLDLNKSEENERLRRHIQKIDASGDKHTFIVAFDGWVIGTFSILVEPKIIHNLAAVAHVEDVVIRSEFRKCGLGRQMMEFVEEFCRTYDKYRIYKVILECADSVIGFYEKSGYRKAGNSMRLDLD
jgi:NDP-sugar pyrophosphorylase family protein/predicted GNAT family N-acyltransferase